MQYTAVQAMAAESETSGGWPAFMAGQPDRPIRVAIVDDDPHMRRVITQELMRDRRTVVAGQAASLREARRLVREVDFDVVLLSLALADGVAYDLIAHIKTWRIMAEVVIVSALESEADAVRAFALGATGFLVKHCWFSSFVQSVLQVANGGACITPTLARRLLTRKDRAATPPAAQAAWATSPNRLSARETEILRMIASGHTSPEISSRLTISQLTVNTHVRNIYQKLHVKTRAQAVNCASSWGFL